MVRATVAAVLAALVVVGCGGKEGGLDKVVARSGDIEVTLADFDAAWRLITPQNRPDISTLEAKQRFANDLLNQRILLAEAHRMGGITEPGAIEYLEGQRRNEMTGALYRDEVESSVEVRAAEVEELYERRKFRLRASSMLFPDMATAQRVHAEVASGKTSFQDAASKYSIDANRNRGGALGEISWAFGMPEFQAKAFELEPGTMSEPFETAFGVHIVRADERVEQELEPLEAMRPVLRNEVRRQKQQIRAREFVAELATKHELAWNEAGVQTLEAAIVEMAKLDPESVEAPDRFLPVVDEEDRATVLATYRGGQWTIGDYVDRLRAVPPPNRPTSRIPASGLKEFILGTQLTDPLAYIEAEERKLQDRPEIRDAVQRREEEMLLDILHARFLQTVDLAPEEVRAFYDSTLAANPEAMALPERVDMRVLAHNKESAVRAALARMKAGEDELAVLREVTMDMRCKGASASTGLVARGNYAPQVEDIAFSGRVGKGWCAPIVTEGGAASIKVLAQEPAHTATFEEVETELTRSIAQARGERAFEDWLNQERDRRGIEVFDDVLELYGQAVTESPAGGAAKEG